MEILQVLAPQLSLAYICDIQREFEQLVAQFTLYLNIRKRAFPLIEDAQLKSNDLMFQIV